MAQEVLKTFNFQQVVTQSTIAVWTFLLLYRISKNKKLTVTADGCLVGSGGLLGFELLLQELERSDLSKTRGSDKAN